MLQTGSVLPPWPKVAKGGAGEGEEGGSSEPGLNETRTLLENTLFNHSLITPEVLEERHRMSVGKNFQAFLERAKAPRGGGSKETAPVWERLHRLPVPLLMIYGKQDRGAAAARPPRSKSDTPV